MNRVETTAVQVGMGALLAEWKRLRSAYPSGRAPIDLPAHLINQGDGVFWKVSKRPGEIYLQAPGPVMDALKQREMV